MVRNMSSQIIGMTFFWDLLRRDKNNQIFKSATNEVRASSTDVELTLDIAKLLLRQNVQSNMPIIVHKTDFLAIKMMLVHY